MTASHFVTAWNPYGVISDFSKAHEALIQPVTVFEMEAFSHGRAG